MSLCYQALLLPFAAASLLPREIIYDSIPDIPEMGEQSCVNQWYRTGTPGPDEGRKLCFTTNVGAVWDNGRGCPGILEVLNAACQPGVLDWKCEAGGPQPKGERLDYTTLHFCCTVSYDQEFFPSSQEVAAPVNEALEGIYAGAVRTVFNCGIGGRD